MGSVNYTFNGPRLKLSMIAQARQGLRELAIQAETICQSYCPVDTGAMHNSIEVVAGTRGSGGGAANRDLVFTLSVGVSYATYVEYGTSRQRPQPFVRPTLEWVKANMVNIVIQYGFGHGIKMDIPQTYGDVM
jgi:HK97 gp10 family phage protein